ncbi:MAG: hypothetical protein WED85_00255 [Dehalococcoidia bacterium]
MIGNRGATVALVGMAGLLLVMAAVSGWRGTHRLTNRGDDTRAVEEVAKSFVEAYGTFDFRDPGSYQQRLLSLTTGQVREAVLTTNVDPAALARQLTMTANVVSVEVTAQSDDEATASVTAEQARRIVDTTSGQLVDERVTQTADCRLVKEAGSWRVAEFHLRSEEPQTNQTER